MEPKVVAEPATLPSAISVEVSANIVNALAQTEFSEWDAFFNALRLNVQSRILSSPREDLVKLQGRVEQIEDERAFFKKLFTLKAQTRQFT